MNNANSTYSTNIHPTIQGNYPWWILEGLPHISTEATAQGFDAYLTPNFPQRPPDLAPGSADRDIKYRQDIQRDYDTRIGRFIATVKAMTEKSAYKSGVTGFLTQKNPIAALQYIETSLIRESGLSSAKEIMDKFFDTYSKSGKFPNQGTLDQDLQYATNMIDLAVQSLSSIQTNPTTITSNEKGIWLRKLLMPHTRFQPIFAANQVSQKKYNPMVRAIVRAITSINQYKAYAGLEVSAEQAKLNHSQNEVTEPDQNEKAAAAQESHPSSNRRSQRTKDWQNNRQYRDRSRDKYRDTSPGRRGRSPTPHNARSHFPHNSRHYRHRSNSSHRSNNSYGSRRHYQDSNHYRYDDRKRSYNHNRRSSSRDRDYRNHGRDNYYNDRNYDTDHNRDNRDSRSYRSSSRDRYHDRRSQSPYHHRSRSPYQHHAHAAQSSSSQPVHLNFYQLSPGQTIPSSITAPAPAPALIARTSQHFNPK